MTDPTLPSQSRENDLLFQLRRLREENERLREDRQGIDAVDTLTEESWIWDGDQWQRPAQPEQEPCGGCGGSGWISRDPDIGTDQECFVCEGTGKNIDTTLPQRTWVGLTDEELETTRWSSGFRAGAKWFEAKLKEKNT